MNYKLWLMKHGLSDSKENYAKYVKEYEQVCKKMNSAMVEQYIEANYKFRFVNHM